MNIPGICEFDDERNSRFIPVSSIKMNVSLGSIARWTLSTFFILASLQRSEAIQWRKQPNKPTILIERVNNTDVNLEWNFFLDADEIVQNVLFQRKKSGSGSAITLASRLSSSLFTFLDSEYLKKYNALLPNTLLLRNVNNNEEYIYSIMVTYVKDFIVQPPYTDRVEVIVYVPPRITRQPLMEYVVSAGQNLVLMCNASGDPTPSITWTKDGVPQNRFNVSGYWLYLFNIQIKDVGSYRCTARNEYGVTCSITMVKVNCPPNQCQVVTVGITMTSVEWEQAFTNQHAVEHKMLKSNLSSAIASIYTLPQNAAKQLYELTIVEFRPGSTIAVVQLKFHNDVIDPLEPLQDDVADGNIGPFTVATQLDLDPNSQPMTASTDETTTETQQGPTTSEVSLASSLGTNAGQVATIGRQVGSSAKSIGQKGAEIGVIVGGTSLFVLARAVVN